MCNINCCKAETKGENDVTIKELIAELKRLSEKTCNADDDDFIVNDYAGGNIDDAYDIGVEHGEILLSRKLIKLLEQ
jgi:hypothetical protein